MAEKHFNSDEGVDNQSLSTALFIKMMQQQTDAITALSSKIDESENRILEQINSQLEPISNAVSSLQETVKMHENKIDHHEKVIADLTTKNDEQAEKIKKLEISMRKKNILVHNLPENENNEDELKTTFIRTISDELEVNLSNTDIDSLYRIGKKGTKNPRPLLVVLFSFSIKQSIMQKRAKARNIGLSDDFPKDVVEARRKLIPTLEKFRKEGKRVMFKIDKLIVDGKVWQEEVENCNKRKAEYISPTVNDSKRSSNPISVVQNETSSSDPHTSSKLESPRQFLGNTKKTSVCTPIKNFLAKKAVGEIKKTTTETMDLNKTIK